MYNEKMAWPGTMKIVFGWAFLWRTMVFGNESTNISTVLFSDKSEVLHDRVELNKIAPITDKEYYVGGCTALLDAIGWTGKFKQSLQLQES